MSVIYVQKWPDPSTKANVWRSITDVPVSVVGDVEEMAEESFAAWCAEQPYVQPADVPTAVTARQLRLALLSSGVSLAAISAAIAGLPEPQRVSAEIEWEYASTFDRTNPLLCGLGSSLGITPEQIDALFRQAALL